MISIRQSGNFNNAEKFFKVITSSRYLNMLNRFGREGVSALEAATPVETSETAKAWDYTITKRKNGVKLAWTNSNIVDGVSIAVILQYGHGTRNGGYVQGRDYINPVIQPIFDKILIDMWEEVTS